MKKKLSVLNSIYIRETFKGMLVYDSIILKVSKLVSVLTLRSLGIKLVMIVNSMLLYLFMNT